uniref:NudC domain containing 1 n=1 Tax=Astyanax mexicanus TaxID=7994 RepID=A0A8B9HFA3_ASTMX
EPWLIKKKTDTALWKPREVFRMNPDLSSCEGERVCSSLSLTSATWAALSDGAGNLTLLRTSKRGESSHLKWEAMFSESLGEPFIILHSLSNVQAGVHTIQLLLLRIQKDPADSKGSGFSTLLEWITLDNSTGECEEKKYEVRKRRLMKGRSVPHYAALEPEGKGLMVASEKPFSFKEVDGVPLEEEGAEDMEVEPSGEFKVLLMMIFNSASRGLSSVESLEISLQKRSEGPLWSELVLGDRRGEYIMNEEQAAQIQQRLAHLTAEELNANPEKDKPACNAQELEDCDGFPEDSSTLMRFDGATLKPTHVVNLGSHQYLFTVETNPSEMPAFCLRHDVDALLWQPRPEQPDSLWEHTATFNALGYVQASKRDKKFATCAPNFSYAALAECLKRVFIYRQPSPVDTVLFNRKQGRQVGQVAKQQVANLESNHPVLGFRATNERLFALTCNNLFILKVNN